MAGRLAPGSMWHRWDPHIHTPGTILADQYSAGVGWEQFLNRVAIFRVSPIGSPSAFGGVEVSRPSVAGRSERNDAIRCQRISPYEVRHERPIRAQAREALKPERRRRPPASAIASALFSVADARRSLRQGFDERRPADQLRVPDKIVFRQVAFLETGGADPDGSAERLESRPSGLWKSRGHS